MWWWWTARRRRRAAGVCGRSRAGLAARVRKRLDAFPSSPDSEEGLLKLVELAEMGPSTRVLVQLGLDRPRYKHLMPAVRTLLQANARKAWLDQLEFLRNRV